MLGFFTGIISGAFSGIGMGGGAILILILSVFMGIDQHVAQATNLVFFIPTSIAAIITTAKEKLIDWKIGIPVAISGIISSIYGAKLSVNLEVKTLRRYFGFFLMIITIYEIYSFMKMNKKQKNKDNKKKIN